jgi:hypothetical protein
MKLILFIGHHKVGSSALQTWLARQALPLLRRGILYPAVEAQGMATLLDMALKGRDAPAGALPVNFREAHNALAFGLLAEDSADRPVPALHEGLPPADDMLRAILRQIEVFDPHTVILAAEVLANFGAVAPHLIDRLLGAFAGAEVHLTATFRRVDDYLVSWHGQRLRFGQTPRSLPGGALQRYMRGIHFNYRLVLDPWLQRLPDAQVRLRAYDQVLAAGGAVQDFLTGYGIDPVPGVPAEPKVNAGLHRALQEIARQGNRALGPHDAHELFRGLMQAAPRLDLPPSAAVEMFGADARAEMAAGFAPVHDWLSDRAGAPFFADADQIGEVLPRHEHDVNLQALAQLQAGAATTFGPAQRAFLDALVLEPNFPAAPAAAASDAR